MGRGRAKAKQTKVARKLKYGVPQTDLERLEAELQGKSGDDADDTTADDTYAEDPYSEDPYAEDPYAGYVEDDGERE